MKRNIIIILILVITAITGFVFFNLSTSENNQKADFDPSAYYVGDSVSQEEIDSILTQEEQQEIERLLNE